MENYKVKATLYSYITVNVDATTKEEAMDKVAEMFDEGLLDCYELKDEELEPKEAWIDDENRCED